MQWGDPIPEFPTFSYHALIHHRLLEVLSSQGHDLRLLHCTESDYERYSCILKVLKLGFDLCGNSFCSLLKFHFVNWITTILNQHLHSHGTLVIGQHADYLILASSYKCECVTVDLNIPIFFDWEMEKECSYTVCISLQNGEGPSFGCNADYWDRAFTWDACPQSWGSNSKATSSWPST